MVLAAPQCTYTLGVTAGPDDTHESLSEAHRSGGGVFGNCRLRTALAHPLHGPRPLRVALTADVLVMRGRCWTQCVPLMNNDETGLPRKPQGSTGSKGWGQSRRISTHPFIRHLSVDRKAEPLLIAISHVEQRAERPQSHTHRFGLLHWLPSMCGQSNLTHILCFSPEPCVSVQSNM